MYINGNGGLLVGQSTGKLDLKNVKVTGFVNCSGDECGGLIGKIQGNLDSSGVSFKGIVKGHTHVAGIVGEIGSNQVKLTGLDVYASVTANNGQKSNGAAVCHSNSSNPGVCNVSGSVQVSGTYATCPGAGTA